MKFASIYLTVDDMERALKFYSKLFAVEPDVRDQRYSSFLLPDGGKIDLYNPGADGERRVIGTNIVPVFHVSDVDKALAHVRSVGAEVVCEPMEIGEVRLFQFKDTEGNTLEMYSEK